MHPPVLHTSEHGPTSTEDTEALVICCETARGNVFMNIALRYNEQLPDGARRLSGSGEIGLRTSDVGLLALSPRTFGPSGIVSSLRSLPFRKSMTRSIEDCFRNQKSPLLLIA